MRLTDPYNSYSLISEVKFADNIQTAFFVSAMPSCSWFEKKIWDIWKNCENLEKFNGTGFIISTNSKQRYAAFRLKSGQPSVNFITNANDMPFKMQPKDVINKNKKPNIWPNISSKSYLSATYDRTNYSIVYLIKEFIRNEGDSKGFMQITLCIVPVNDLKNFKRYYTDEITQLSEIIGLFEWTKPNTNIRKIFAIFGNKTTNVKQIRQFKFPGVGNAMQFIEQVYNC